MCVKLKIFVRVFIWIKCLVKSSVIIVFIVKAWHRVCVIAQTFVWMAQWTLKRVKRQISLEHSFFGKESLLELFDLRFETSRLLDWKKKKCRGRRRRRRRKELRYIWGDVWTFAFHANVCYINIEVVENLSFNYSTCMSNQNCLLYGFIELSRWLNPRTPKFSCFSHSS